MECLWETWWHTDKREQQLPAAHNQAEERLCRLPPPPSQQKPRGVIRIQVESAFPFHNRFIKHFSRYLSCCSSSPQSGLSPATHSSFKSEEILCQMQVMIWEEITKFSLFLGDLNKQIELVLLSSGRFLAQSTTFGSKSWCHHSSTVFFSWVNPQVDNGITAEKGNSGGYKWEYLRPKDHSQKLQETGAEKAIQVF